MINLGTFIICCICSSLAGVLIGEQIGQAEYEKRTKELKDYYMENTRKLLDFITKIREDKKGGE